MSAPEREREALVPLAGQPAQPAYEGQGGFADLDQGGRPYDAHINTAAIGLGETATTTAAAPQKRIKTWQRVVGGAVLLGFGGGLVAYYNGVFDTHNGGNTFTGDDPDDGPDGVPGPNNNPDAPVHPMFDNPDSPNFNPGNADVQHMFQDGVDNDQIRDVVSVLLGSPAGPIVSGGDNHIVDTGVEVHQYGYTTQFHMDSDPDKSYTMAVMQPSGDFVDDLFDRVEQGTVIEVPVDQDSNDPEDMYFYDVENDVILYFHNHFPLDQGDTSIVVTIQVSGGADGPLGQYAGDKEDLRMAVDKYVRPALMLRDQYFGDGSAPAR